MWKHPNQPRVKHWPVGVRRAAQTQKEEELQ